MKIDILAVLHEEYPDFLDSKDDFVSDNMKEFQNSEVHLKNLHELLAKEENYIESILLKEILDLVSEIGYDTSCEYFAAITKKFSAYVRVGKNRVIVVDDLLKSGLIEFYILVFAWANNINDSYTFEYCIKNMIYLLDMRCTKKTTGTISHEKDKEWFRTLDESILTIASNCYWVSWCFMVLHEIGHLILEHTETIDDINHEYEADKFAYDIILRLIEKHNKSTDEILSVFREYTCFSPMMLLDFYRMIDIFQSLIYPNTKQKLKPEPQKRIDRLIGVGIDKFDISEGNDVYNNYLDVLEIFTEQLISKYMLGKLDFLPSISAE